VMNLLARRKKKTEAVHLKQNVVGVHVGAPSDGT
jgi:hypothetical protein